MRKYLKITALLIVLLLISSVCFAANPVAKGDATMSLIEDNKVTTTFGKYGEFEKKMVKIDTTNKTIDISLTARNNQEIAEDKPGDVCNKYRCF